MKSLKELLGMTLLHMMIVDTMVIVIVECLVSMKLSTDSQKMIEGSALRNLKTAMNIFYKCWTLLCNTYSSEIKEEELKVMSLGLNLMF